MVYSIRLISTTPGDTFTEVLYLNKSGGFLNFEVDNLSVASIDYFKIEGRSCAVELDGFEVNENIISYLVDNETSAGVVSERSLTENNKYLGISATVENRTNNTVEFYGGIKKNSIKYNHKTKELSFKIDDIILINAQIKHKIDMSYLHTLNLPINMQLQNLTWELNNNLTGDGNLLPYLNQITIPEYSTGLTMSNYVLSENEGFGKNDLSSDNVKVYSRITHPTDTPDTYTLANTAKLSMESQTTAFGATTIQIRFRFANNFIGNIYDGLLEMGGSTSENYQYYNWNSDTLVNSASPNHEGYVQNLNVGDFGTTTLSELQTYIDDKLAVLLSTYFPTFVTENKPYWHASTNDLYTNSVNPNISWSYELSDASTLLGSGNYMVGYANLIEVDENQSVTDVLSQLLFITNNTIYQQGFDLIVKPKYSNLFNYPTPVFTISTSDLLEMNTSYVLYEIPDYEKNIDLFDVAENLSEILEQFYSELQIDLNSASEIVVDNSNVASLGDIIQIDSTLYFILSLSQNAEEYSTKYKILRIS